MSNSAFILQTFKEKTLYVGFVLRVCIKYREDLDYTQVLGIHVLIILNKVIILVELQNWQMSHHLVVPFVLI